MRPVERTCNLQGFQSVIGPCNLDTHKAVSLLKMGQGRCMQKFFARSGLLQLSGVWHGSAVHYLVSQGGLPARLKELL